MTYKILLTAQEAADYLGFPLSRIRYETFLKRIPFIKLGRSVRYSRPDLDAWIAGLKGGAV